jgi:hypothetical protein
MGPKKKKARAGGPPEELDFEKALMYFHAYMYGPLQGKLRLYQARNVRAAGKVMTSDWEVFASILVKDVGTKLGKGIDLSRYEVKSAENGGSYEYQYHKLAGLKKLKDDMKAGHLFFEHSDSLRKVDLWYVSGSLLQRYFKRWLAEFPVPYEQQRFRRAVPAGWVREHGQLLMRLRDGEVAFPETKPESVAEARAGVQPRDES